MAINFTDFSKMPLQESALKNIWEDLLTGYKIGKEPARMEAERQAKEEEQKKRKLDTGIKELELEHKPKEYELSDKQKALEAKLKQTALDTYADKQELDRRYKESQINKNNRVTTNGGHDPRLTGAVNNADLLWKFEHGNEDPTPELKAQHLKVMRDAFNNEQEKIKKATERTQVLNDTQYNRGLTQVSKKHDELRDIDKGKFPGTNDKLTPQQQNAMRNDLLLSLTKDVTDPATRQKLQAATNMNITLDSIDAKALTQFSGAKGKIDKIADSILESVGAGSPEYQNYLKEAIKASAAAKQMRQYLGDSIQPSAQTRLDHLANPEAWNVSPKVAQENFEFIRDLYKRETQTLVRAVTDPTLFTAQQIGNPPTNQNNSQGFDWNKYPVAGR